MQICKGLNQLQIKILHDTHASSAALHADLTNACMAAFASESADGGCICVKVVDVYIAINAQDDMVIEG